MEQSHQFQEEDLERLRKLRLMDDDFMSKCFEDNVECAELVIQIVLDRKDLRIEQVHTQHQIKNLQGRSVILDIYAVDKTGKQYNIEIQRADRGAVAKRARYHSSVIDANAITSTQGYDKLPETYVIFITENDVLKKNLPIYHIDRVIQETGAYFGDESHIIYVNGAYRDDSPLGILMQDFSCNNPADMYYKPLYERTKYFKETQEGVAAMCKLMEDMRNEAAEEAAKKATEEAAKKAARETASKLLRFENLSYEKVSEYSNLPLEEVKELAKEIGA